MSFSHLELFRFKEKHLLLLEHFWFFFFLLLYFNFEKTLLLFQSGSIVFLLITQI